MRDQFWWYVARASGMVAWATAAMAVVWGLLLSTKAAKGRARPAWLLDLHRYLGGLAVLLTLTHLGALVADTFVHFGPADLLVPGASPYKRLGVATGIVAFWLLVLVELTSLARKRLSKRVWSRIHLSSFVAYVLATLHYLQVGTERTNPVMLLTVEVTTALVLGLTVYRVLMPSSRGAARDAGSGRAVRTSPDRSPRPHRPDRALRPDGPARPPRPAQPAPSARRDTVPTDPAGAEIVLTGPRR
jgi:DMSO/TMAO reductase YedYZ heme-binding membrane subunit